MDLAGSEEAKTKRTRATAEYKNVKNSLSALGTVLNALTRGSPHDANYDDPKLIQILQDVIVSYILFNLISLPKNLFNWFSCKFAGWWKLLLGLALLLLTKFLKCIGKPMHTSLWCKVTEIKIESSGLKHNSC